MEKRLKGGNCRSAFLKNNPKLVKEINENQNC